MKVYDVNNLSFKKYGRILKGFDFTQLINKLCETTDCPMDKTIYVPSDPTLEALPAYKFLRTKVYGEMPIQIGYCNGFNKKLNALEYHRDSEIDIVANDVILILGLRADINDDFTYDTSKCEAFLIPKGTAVEIFATSLHYSPACPENEGFRMAVILTKGTNTKLSEKHGQEFGEDLFLTAVNKWLLRHEECNDSDCPARLVGENLSIS